MASRGPSKGKFELSQLRITRGAMIVAGLELGLSLVWLMSGDAARATMADWLVASPDNIWRHGRVWTLVTSPFLDINFIALVLHLVVLWSFVPNLERFWGTPRFYRFVAITSIVGGVAGTALGLATGHDVPIVGLDPFIYASIVAFGIVYAKQPVQFFGALPLTGRQLMFGFLAFLALYVGLQSLWEQGAGMAAAMIAAALIVAKRSPLMVWRRWRLARRRAKLTLIPGGVKRDEKTWLN